jgi:FKBP-type peptidyl-prolyl cis-trans isomerase
MKHSTSRLLGRTGSILSMSAFAAMAAVAQSANPPVPVPVPVPVPATDQNSYLFGLTFGTQMKTVGITNEVSVDAIARGLADGLKGRQPTPAEQQQLQTFVRSVAEAGVARNQSAAADFLAHNTHENGVVTTASGLQYRILAAGDKKAPPITPTDTVTVQYRGKLLDGTEFDSSYSRGVPATFPVNGVIQGWQQALVLMKPGAKWQLFIPPALGYGASPKPGIPGGSLLKFDVELIRVEPPPGSTPPAAPPGSPQTKR